ncbi:hypothetical protein PGB90_002783 [Kerria lacca]
MKLKKAYQENNQSNYQNKDGFSKNKRIRKMSNTPFKEVFLGGSCNPTTWRRDVAIPILEKCDISFYNPQVTDWSPELIELEHQAKENALILLYVIDTETRNVVSLIETSHFLGNRRNVIIVLNSYQGPGQIIGCEKITLEEFHDLNTSLVLFQQLIERRKVSVFSDVIEGMNKSIEEIKNSHKLIHWFLLMIIFFFIYRKMKEAFESLDTEKCGLISSKDICKALRLLTQKRSQSAELRKNILQKIDAHQSKSKSMKVNFEQFCKIVSELNLNCDKKNNGNIEKRTNCKNFFRSLSTPDDKPTFINEEGIHLIDIYLGGDCYQYLNWRQKVAIPMIRNACLTFYNPENERNTNQKLLFSEFAAINNSNVLLFVISNSSRSLFAMILAAYYIGVGADVILCIQNLPEHCIIGSDKLSQQAVKDYNRGRHYLTDIARRGNVPIFESVPDAVKFAINKCIK